MYTVQLCHPQGVALRIPIFVHWHLMKVTCVVVIIPYNIETEHSLFFMVNPELGSTSRGDQRGLCTFSYREPKGRNIPAASCRF